MKIILFKTGRKHKKYRNKKKISAYIFEKILFSTFVIVFLSLIIVQAAMINPKVREVLVNENSFEGNPLQVEEYLYKKGEIFISLKSENANKKVKVLLNGDTIASFTSNVIKLYVKDGDVVEIDSTMADNAEVEIISASSNIIDKYKGTKLKLNSEIKQLTKIQID
ncbi:MAG TPA: hypothetical protein GX727_06515 [Clostridium sp.]|jgi:hypothetical protein|nr:hypothetical protein [Clostridium sp.]